MLDQPNASMVVTEQLTNCKRKFDDAFDEEDHWGQSADGQCYIKQRESVFNISMGKLAQYREVPNPSLRRSVLICNTLRSIEEEMRAEMIQVSPNQECVTPNPFVDLPGHMPTGADNSSPSYSPYPICNLDLDQSSPPVPLFLGRSFCQNFEDEEKFVCDSSSSSSDGSENGVKCFLDLDSTGRATPYINDHVMRTNDWEHDQDEKPSIMHWETCESINGQHENSNVNTYRSHFRINSYKPIRNGFYLTDSDFFDSSNNDSAYSSSSSNCSNLSASGSSSVLTELELALYDFDLSTSPLPQSRLPALSAEELIRTFPAGQQSSAVNACDSDTSDDSDSNEKVLVGL